MHKQIKDIEFDFLIPKLKGATNKQLMRALAQLAAPHCHTDETSLLEALEHQETRSSSAQGDGTAVFHLQIQGPQKPIYLLATLSHEIDMDASDGQDVDVVALLISPLKDGPLHLRRLARLSRLLANKTLHARLIEAKDELDMKAVLIDPEGWMLAA